VNLTDTVRLRSEKKVARKSPVTNTQGG